MSERKINHQYIENYSNSFSDKVVDEFFSDKKEISGKEIVSLTKSKQVNFLVIKSLFYQWQEETKKLESPFFDFKNDKVRRALVQFMNTLSQYISIEKESFKPLLKDAIEDAIYLVFSPLDFFLAEVSQKHPTHLPIKNFKSIGKYVKIHTEPLSQFISQLEDTGKDRLDIDIALQLLNDVFENVESTELEVNNFVKAISAIESFDVNNIFIREEAIEEVEEETEPEPVFDMDKFLEEETEVQEVKEEPSPAPLPKSENQEDNDIQNEIKSAIEAGNLDQIPSSEPPVKQNKTVDDFKVKDDVDVDDDVVISNFDDDDIDEFIDTTDIPPVDLQPKGVIMNYEEEEDEEPAILNKNFASEPVATVNDNLKGEEDTTLADSIANKQVDNIFSTISVNQRYMFTNELFGGNGDEFREAVYHVEECETFDAAVEILVQKYAKDYKWDMSSVEVKELLKVIFRKFRS